MELRSLGLHTAARNNFVTSWLPSFIQLSHGNKNRVAITFVSQAAIEESARLDIVPKPDCVVRVARKAFVNKDTIAGERAAIMASKRFYEAGSTKQNVDKRPRLMEPDHYELYEDEPSADDWYTSSEDSNDRNDIPDSIILYYGDHDRKVPCTHLFCHVKNLIKEEDGRRPASEDDFVLVCEHAGLMLQRHDRLSSKSGHIAIYTYPLELNLEVYCSTSVVPGGKVILWTESEKNTTNKDLVAVASRALNRSEDCFTIDGGAALDAKPSLSWPNGQPIVRITMKEAKVMDKTKVKDKTKLKDKRQETAINDKREETEISNKREGTDKTQVDEEKVTLRFSFPNRPDVVLKASPAQSISSLEYALAETVNEWSLEMLLFRAGVRLDAHRKLSDYAIVIDGASDEEADEFVIDVHQSVTAGASIHLLPPRDLPKVEITLTLCPEWRFVSAYPSGKAATDEKSTSTVKWTVAAKTNGEMSMPGDWMGVRRLCWDARVDMHSEHPFQQLSSSMNLFKFNPERPAITPQNAVVRSVDALTLYLEDELKILGVSASATAYFMSDNKWNFTHLSNGDKNDVAITFVSQAAFENSARLNIVPKPDYVARIFMLFKAVDKHEKKWDVARNKLKKVNWAKVIGIDSVKMEDKSLFRVIECGSMQVC
ncbi:hypothetical protein ACM66B_003465 [Microbotryomycetes sp. NB124-2]